MYVSFFLKSVHNCFSVFRGAFVSLCYTRMPICVTADNLANILHKLPYEGTQWNTWHANADHQPL